MFFYSVSFHESNKMFQPPLLSLDLSYEPIALKCKLLLGEHPALIFVHYDFHGDWTGGLIPRAMFTLCLGSVQSESVRVLFSSRKLSCPQCENEIRLIILRFSINWKVTPLFEVCRMKSQRLCLIFALSLLLAGHQNGLPPSLYFLPLKTSDPLKMKLHGIKL